MSDNVVRNTNHGSLESTSQMWCREGRKTRQAPISKLPEDTLLIIFIMVRDWDWVSRTTVTRITHVCRDWRLIAIGAPLLWTRTLSSSYPNWTALALQRALTAPVEVDIDFVDTNGISEISRVLLGHLSHTSKLVLIGSYDHLDDAQKLIADEDTTQLEELSIWCIDLRTAATEPSRSFVLSSTTFCQAPQLRRLTLDRVDIDFNSPLLRNLTTLRLGHVSDTAPPTWSKLIEVLHAMPLLEHLKLEDVLPQTTASVFTTSVTPIDLNSLQTFSAICDTASQIFILLASIHFPPLSTFNLQWGVDDLPEQMDIFQDIAKSAHARHLGSEFGTLEVEQTPLSSRVHLSAFMHGGPGLFLWFPQESIEIGNVQFIEDSLNILFLSNITTFWLKIDHEYGHLDLLRLTSAMPLLEFVTVGNKTAFNFIEILDVEPLSSKSQLKSPSQVCLPNLEHITWAGGNFSGRETWVDEVAVAAFSRRRERGLEIKTLEFNDVENLTPKLVGMFEKGVTEVLIRNLDFE